MVFEWRINRKLNFNLKKTLIALLIGFLFINPAMVLAKTDSDYSVQKAEETSTKPSSDVLQGSVSVDITPYCENWSSKYAEKQINRIGTKLITANNIDKDIRFVVIKKKDANAYANMQDVITVYTGLLKYVETEDELAYVLGHEMGHISKSHVKKSVARSVIIATAGVTGSVLSIMGAVNNSEKMSKSGAIIVGGALAGKFTDTQLSKGQETKSDLASIDYLVNAGYNPLASISIMNKISGNYFDLFSDHPSGTKRIKRMYKYIEKNYPEYIEQGFDSVSYNRALKIINKNKKNKKNQNDL